MSPLLRSIVAVSFTASLFADEIDAKKKPDDRYPAGTSLSDDAQAALKNFAVAPGLQVEVWASEPLFANPVALAFDHAGRAYVAETNRRRSSVPDIRKFDEWVIANLALRSVEDRPRVFQSEVPESAKAKPTKERIDHNGDGQYDWRDLGVESERVRVVEDSNGDGKADQSRVLAEGFNSPATGVGAGWWRMMATSSTPARRTCGASVPMARRKSLLSGFGVHVAYSGHDMHGAKIGPDGRLYFSIADCGAHVVGKEGQVIDVPDSGAIFPLRDPTAHGSNSWPKACAIRNRSRGTTSAIFSPATTTPTAATRRAGFTWSRRRLRLAHRLAIPAQARRLEQRRHVAPRCGREAPGHSPAGRPHRPRPGGHRLLSWHRPARHVSDHFFYADFPGGVRAFKLTPKGASYTVENPGDILQDNKPQNLTGKVLWNLYPSDLSFAPGGGLFVLDWVQGWEKTGKGRIFVSSRPKPTSPRARPNVC
jgi:quinoprotein glucose dehydrogenase